MPDPARLTIDLVYGPLTLTFYSPTRADRAAARELQTGRAEFAAQLASLAEDTATVPDDLRHLGDELLERVEDLLIGLLVTVTQDGKKTEGEAAKAWVRDNALFTDWTNALEAFNQVYFRRWVQAAGEGNGRPGGAGA